MSMSTKEAREFLYNKMRCMDTCVTYGGKTVDECEECEYCYAQGNIEQQIEALRMAIDSFETQIKIKEILATPLLFAEKFDRICELNKIFDDKFSE